MPNWPGKLGFPANPEQNGAHQLTNSDPTYPLKGPWVVLWNAQDNYWVDIYGNVILPGNMARHHYIGPLTPPASPTAPVLNRYSFTVAANFRAYATASVEATSEQEATNMVQRLVADAQKSNSLENFPCLGGWSVAEYSDPDAAAIDWCHDIVLEEPTKSEIAAQAAAERDIPVVNIPLPEVNPLDFSGLPILSDEVLEYSKSNHLCRICGEPKDGPGRDICSYPHKGTPE